VLLVLLIIFMMITPKKSTGLEAGLPQPAPDTRPSPATNDLVITVLGNDTVQLNEEQVALTELTERLKTWLKSAPRDVIFVKARGDLDFQEIAQVIDIARGVGLTRVGLLTE